MYSSNPLSKADLRRRMRALRQGLVARRDASSAQAAALAPAETWAKASIVAGYRAQGSEIDPAPLLERLAAAGMRIVLPVVVAPGAPLMFREAGATADHVRDAAGVLAPPPWALVAVPRLVIAPLLAFDRAGGRLGQGGGYYDRTISDLRARGPLWVVGLAYSQQEVADAHMGPADQRLDAILTEKVYSEI